MLRHRDEHVRCLSRWFNITLVNYDCDYERLCEKVNPELALFETGVNTRGCHRLKIRNVRGVDVIPKIALLNADGWSETRSAILADSDTWGIDVLFSISVTAAEHTPIISDRLFVWPNCVEPGVFRDYGLSKTMPILITGSQHSHYPWRQAVCSRLVKHFSSLVCPHGGYESCAATRQMLYGEPYARVINAAFFVPACGSVANEVVRKHFEIPACKTCLIAEDSPGLRAAGFVDMKNCVFADENDVVEKVAHLLAHKDEMAAICEAGHELVMTRHTAAHRDQIYRWFKLHRELKQGERVIQKGPFDPLSIAGPESNARNAHVVSNGRHLRLLHEGDEAFAAGNYAAAERSYSACLSYLPVLPEAKVKLTLCDLHLGKPRMALRSIIDPIRYILSYYGAQDPDPVEWAYLIIALLCSGRLREAERRANQFPELHHPELDRVRSAVDALCRGALFEERSALDFRASVHVLPNRSTDEWVLSICAMLEACRQTGLAKRLDATRFSSTAPNVRSLPRSQALDWISAIPALVLRRRPTLRYFDNPLLAEAIARRLARLFDAARRAVASLWDRWPDSNREPRSSS